MGIVLIWEKVLILGRGVSHLRYSLYRIDYTVKILVLKLDFFYNFRKKISDLKMFPVIQGDFLFAKLEKNFPHS